MKQSFDIGGCFCLSTFCRVVSIKVMQVALYIYLASSGAAIPKPSTVETPAVPPWNEWSEIGNGDLQSREMGSEKGVDVSGPRSGVWIDRAKLGENGSAKSSASVGAASLKVVAPDKVSAKGGDKQTSENSDDVISKKFKQFFHGALLAMLIAWPIIYFGDAGPYGGMKHNVSDQRPRRSGRKPRFEAVRCIGWLGVSAIGECGPLRIRKDPKHYEVDDGDDPQ